MKYTKLIPLLLLAAVLVVSGCVGQSGNGDGQASNSVKFTMHSELGSILTDGSGRTLYTFDLDKPGDINCLEGSCTVAWPPFTVEGNVQAPAGFEAKIDTVVRPDTGKMQVTYDGKPLYYYSRDTQPGDAKGDGFQGTWHVVKG